MKPRNDVPNGMREIMAEAKDSEIERALLGLGEPLPAAPIVGDHREDVPLLTGIPEDPEDQDSFEAVGTRSRGKIESALAAKGQANNVLEFRPKNAKSIYIPNAEEIAEGVDRRPLTVEQVEQSKDIAFIQNRFPVGSEINIPNRKEGGAGIIKAFVVDITFDAKGPYLTVVYKQENVRSLNKRDISSLAAISHNRNPEDVKKGALPIDQAIQLSDQIRNIRSA